MHVNGTPASATPTVAILGAGASGLCMAIQLQKAGINSFTIYEKSDRVGGTWHDNTYPGACCDVPSHLYSFSFEPNPNWSRIFSPQPEIQEYFDHCVRKYDLTPHIRFQMEITSARFDANSGQWLLDTKSGEQLTAHVLVSGTGQLNRPHTPAIPGLESFAGTAFHSARWNHSADLTDKNIAVVGNGASAIQFVPRLAESARRLHVFQRSANWIIARNDRRYSAKELHWLRRSPALLRFSRSLIYFLLELRFLGFLRGSWVSRRMERQATEYLHSVVSDPQLRKVLTPDYPVGCKRILVSDDYYQALVRPNVEVVTDHIARIEPDGIVTADGTKRPVDTIIFGTGFETTSFLAPMRIEGLGGRVLDETWRDGAEAYLGVTVSGFPNLFLLYGPNTNLGHNSILFMLECQVNYIVQCVQQLHHRRLAHLDVLPHAMSSYNERIQRDLQHTAWAAGCHSWYKTDAGKITNNWSGFTLEYWWRTRRPNFLDYQMAPRR